MASLHVAPQTCPDEQHDYYYQQAHPYQYHHCGSFHVNIHLLLWFLSEDFRVKICCLEPSYRQLICMELGRIRDLIDSFMEWG